MTTPAIVSRPITGYHFDLVCPICGGPVEHVADGRATVTHSPAMAACRPCRAPLRVEVRVTSVRSEDRSLPRIPNLTVVPA